MKEKIFRRNKMLYTKAVLKRLFQRTFIDKMGIRRRQPKTIAGYPIYDYETQHKLIAQMLNEDEPVSILRPGNAEFTSVWMRDENKFYGGKRYRKVKIFSDVGYDEELFDKWVAQFKKDMGEADAVAIFNPTDYYEEYLIRAYYHPKHIFLMPLLEFDPFKAETSHSWLEALNGKRVLVVSLFADTMQKQVPYLDQIWPGINPISNVDFVFQKSVWYLDGESNQFESWYASLEYLDDQIKQKEFDIAIVSCGPFGTFLAANIKRRGKKVLQYGGSLQLLFGIRGKRWENSPISQFFNEYWVRPSKEETPESAKRLENACYW